MELSFTSLKLSVSLIITTPLPDQLAKMRQSRSRVSADNISALGRSIRGTIFSARYVKEMHLMKRIYICISVLFSCSVSSKILAC